VVQGVGPEFKYKYSNIYIYIYIERERERERERESIITPRIRDLKCGHLVYCPGNREWEASQQT
jgi:hypothetical protein